jgi:hypothetical protein
MPEGADRVDTRLRAVVKESGVPEAMAGSYLAFAREFYRAVSRLNIGLPLRLRQREFPAPTRRVVERWFERGLSGKALWRVGSGVVNWLSRPRPGLTHGTQS